MFKFKINLFLTFVLACSTAVANKLPHIVYLLIDDLGYANVGYNSYLHGATDPETPNIDKLRNESGVDLTSYYTYKFCSPTRSSFMSGRLPYHVNSENHPPPMAGGGVPVGMTTLADQLRHGGNYRTHQVGKWHCGMSSPDRLPVARGFDTSFGYLSGAEDHFKKIRSGFIDFWRDTGPSPTNGTTYAATLYTQEAQRIIENHAVEFANRPLFLYQAYQIMHGPNQAPASCINKFPASMYKPRRMCNAMMSALDDSIGQVVGSLKSSGLWNNTLLIFSADNGGPQDHANNWPLRGSKGSDFEGGVRVTAFLAGGWLSKTRRSTKITGTTGTTDNTDSTGSTGSTGRTKITGLFHIADWWATLSAMAGAPMEDAKAAAHNLPSVDSLDMSAMIIGTNATSPRLELVLSHAKSDQESGKVGGSGFIAMIQGTKYKLVRGNQGNGAFPAPRMPNASSSAVAVACGDGCLFNLDADPNEHIDLALVSSYADILSHLQERAKVHDTTFFQSNGSMKADPAAKAAAKTRGGWWGPWKANGTDAGGRVPGPSPGPSPGPPPSKGVFLKFVNVLNAHPELCLTTPELHKASHAELGACDHDSKWTNTGTAVQSASMQLSKARFLRQSPTSNCTLGNTIQLGVDGGSGLIVTRLEGDVLREVSCGSETSLCVGWGEVSGSGASLKLVACTDAAAKGWTAVSAV